jgi:hypothetical protein
MASAGLSVAWIKGPEVEVPIRNQPGAAGGGLPPGARVGTAVLTFERGKMTLALVRCEDGFVWLHGRKPFGRPLATAAAAVQFLKDVCEIYNYTLDWVLPPLEEGQA